MSATLMAAIEARQKAIADGLSSAERAKKNLDLAKANATDQLKEAKLQAAQKSLNRLTNVKPKSLMRRAVGAHTEREKILAQGRAQIDAERHRAKEELRKQVAALAIAGAEKILARHIDQAANSDIVDKLVAEL
ncbi:F0F1 ATP synthase subunit B [Escherichia coli]